MSENTKGPTLLSAKVRRMSKRRQKIWLRGALMNDLRQFVGRRITQELRSDVLAVMKRRMGYPEGDVVLGVPQLLACRISVEDGRMIVEAGNGTN